MANIDTLNESRESEPNLNRSLNQRGILDSDSSDSESGENIHTKLTAELTSYRCGKAEPMTTDPLEFWKQNETVFPNVAQQAKKLLCVPATSLPCERLFSAAGILVDKRRSALRSGHVQQMLCLQSWMQ
jgi:hypothetical protein